MASPKTLTKLIGLSSSAIALPTPGTVAAQPEDLTIQLQVSAATSATAKAATHYGSRLTVEQLYLQVVDGAVTEVPIPGVPATVVTDTAGQVVLRYNVDLLAFAMAWQVRLLLRVLVGGSVKASVLLYAATSESGMKAPLMAGIAEGALNASTPANTLASLVTAPPGTGTAASPEGMVLASTVAAATGAIARISLCYLATNAVGLEPIPDATGPTRSDVVSGSVARVDGRSPRGLVAAVWRRKVKGVSARLGSALVSPNDGSFQVTWTCPVRDDTDLPDLELRIEDGLESVLVRQVLNDVDGPRNVLLTLPKGYRERSEWEVLNTELLALARARADDEVSEDFGTWDQEIQAFVARKCAIPLDRLREFVAAWATAADYTSAISELASPVPESDKDLRPLMAQAYYALFRMGAPHNVRGTGRRGLSQNTATLSEAAARNVIPANKRGGAVAAKGGVSTGLNTLRTAGVPITLSDGAPALRLLGDLTSIAAKGRVGETWPALHLAGAGLTLPDSTLTLRLLGDQTIEAWVYLEAAPQAGQCATIYYKHHSAEGWFYLDAARHPRVGLGSSECADRLAGAFDQVVPLKQWTHLAVVIDRKRAGTVRFYMDGVASGDVRWLDATDQPGSKIEIGSITALKYLEEHCDVPAQIAMKPGGDMVWGGRLAELRVWSVCRDRDSSGAVTSDIAEARNRRASAAELPLLAGYWPLDEATGVVSRDHASHGIDVVLPSGATWQGGPTLLGDGALDAIAYAGRVQRHYVVALNRAIQTSDFRPRDGIESLAWATLACLTAGTGRQRGTATPAHMATPTTPRLLALQVADALVFGLRAGRSFSSAVATAAGLVKDKNSHLSDRLEAWQRVSAITGASFDILRLLPTRWNRRSFTDLRSVTMATEAAWLALLLEAGIAPDQAAIAAKVTYLLAGKGAERYRTWRFIASMAARDDAQGWSGLGALMLSVSGLDDLTTLDIDDVAKHVSATTRNTWRMEIEGVQRLYRIVYKLDDAPEPEVMVYALASCGFGSAYEIAALSKDNFATRTGGVLRKEVAVAIHNQARRIAGKLYTAQIELAAPAIDPWPIVGRPETWRAPSGTDPTLAALVALRTELLFGVDAPLPSMRRASGADCPWAASVHGPVAYLAWVLDLLGRESEPGHRSRTLVDLLAQRRPDLKTLELTSENTEIPVPYIDLLNEVLEHEVLRQAGLAATPAVRTTGTEALRRLIPEYAADVPEVVGTALYPWEALSDATGDRVRDMLTALGVDAATLLDASAGATGTGRAGAALGVSPACLNAVLTTSLALAWGYPSTSTGWTSLLAQTDAPVSEVLRRAGLSFAQLRALLSTRYLKGAVPLSSDGPSVVFGVEGSLDSAVFQGGTLPLDANGMTQLLQRLHAFERLRRALRWDVTTLDRALGVSCAPGALGMLASVDADALKRLGQMAELAALLGKPLELVIETWAHLDLGEGGTYDVLLVPPGTPAEDPLQIVGGAPRGVGTALSALAQDLTVAPRLRAVLGLDDAGASGELTVLIRAIAGARATLGLETLNRLVSAGRLARLLGHTVSDLAAWSAVLGRTAFGKPGEVLAFATALRDWSTTGLLVDEVAWLLGGSAAPSDALDPSSLEDGVAQARARWVADRVARGQTMLQGLTQAVVGAGSAAVRRCVAAAAAEARERTLDARGIPAALVAAAARVAVGNPDTSNVVDALRHALRATLGDRKANVALREIEDRGRIQRRDAMRGWLVEKLSLGSVDELYGRLLIDPAMGPELASSRVKQAISAAQTFLQRVVMGLEQWPSGAVVELSQTDRDEWTWAHSYRIWEANRRIFLYPENWLDPDLRDDKSEIYKQFEADLIQGGMTSANAEKALRGYVNGLCEIANLDVRAVYEEGEAGKDRRVHLLARARTGEPRWYYRCLVADVRWTPWEKLTVDIEGDDVALTVFRGRPRVLWLRTYGKSTTIKARIVLHTNTADHHGKTLKEATPYDTVVERDVATADLELCWSDHYPEGWSRRAAASKRVSLRSAWRAGAITLTAGPDAADANLLSVIIEKRYGRDAAEQFREHPNGDFGNDIFDLEVRSFKLDIQGTLREQSPQRISVQSIAELLGWASSGESCYRPDGNGLLSAIASAMERTLHVESQFDLSKSDDVEWIQYTLDIPLVRSTWSIGATIFRCGDAETTHQLNPAEYTSRVYTAAGTQINNREDIDEDHVATAEEDERIDDRDWFQHQVSTWKDKIEHAVWDEAQAQLVIGYEDDLATLRFVYASNVRAVAFNVAHHHRVVPSAAHRPKVFAAAFVYEPRWNSRLYPMLGYFGSSPRLELQALYHPYAESIRDALFDEGAGSDRIFGQHAHTGTIRHQRGHDPSDPTWLDSLEPNDKVLAWLPALGFTFGPRDAYSLYNWELFFHIPYHVACSLATSARYAEADQWFRYLYDPTAPGGTPREQWQVRPLQEAWPTGVRPLDRMLATTDGTVSPSVRGQLSTSEKEPFNPHAIARERPAAWMRAVILRMVENLIAWGDALFREDTLESLNEAAQLYLRVAELLGPEPELVPRKTRGPVCYDDLRGTPLDPASALGGPIARIETLTWVKDDSAFAGQQAAVAGNVAATRYFGVPANDRLLGLWKAAGERLWKIRSGWDIDGNPRSLPLFEPPLDPALLARARAAGLDLPAAASDTPTPRQRYSYLLGRALELCGDARNFGAALLSSIEKREAEALTLLRSEHEGHLLEVARLNRERAVQEAGEQRAALEAQHALVESRRDHYQGLLERGDLSEEKKQQENMEIAGFISLAASGLDVLAGVVRTAASIVASADTFSPEQRGNIAAEVSSDLSRAASGLAGYYTFQANQAGTRAGRRRRDQEWQQQVDQAKLELKGLDRQILAAEIREAMAQRELDNHNRQIDQVREIDDFFVTKFTSERLYLRNQAALLNHCQALLDLALGYARQAEDALRRETGYDGAPAIQHAGWRGLDASLLGAEALHVQLRNLERLGLDQSAAREEVLRHVSLSSLDARALHELRTHGAASFKLPRWLFDMEIPGQTDRRIRSIAVSAPAVVGPYTGVHLRLSIRNQEVPVPSLVTSTAREDLGVQDLQGRGERYLPLETATLEDSEWDLAFTSPIASFDRSSLADVILHVRYHARPPADALAITTALGQASQDLTGAAGQGPLVRALSARRDFPDLWAHFLANSGRLELEIGPQHLPYFARAGTVQVYGAGAVLVEASGVQALNIESRPHESQPHESRPPGAGLVGLWAIMRPSGREPSTWQDIVLLIDYGVTLMATSGNPQAVPSSPPAPLSRIVR